MIPNKFLIKNNLKYPPLYIMYKRKSCLNDEITYFKIIKIGEERANQQIYYFYQ